MGQFIKAFTLGRNFLKRTVRESADAAHRVVQDADAGSLDLQALKAKDNGRYNVVRDLISFAGIVNRENNACVVTEVGRRYESLYAQSAEDAWRWLVTRTVWLYVVPNGTDAAVNRFATEQAVSFSFFHTLLGVLAGLWSLPGEERFLSYEELCLVLDDDANWLKPGVDLLQTVLANRRTGKASPSSTRHLLGDLEDQYKVGRDNINTVFNKALLQTGLFEYRRDGGTIVAIGLSSSLDPVLQRRVRFVLDNPPRFAPGQDWNTFLQPRANDLPLEVSKSESGGQGTVAPQVPLSPALSEALHELVGRFQSDASVAGLLVDPRDAHRLFASLLSKRFLIATGLAGSGKTKLAQAFARWLTPTQANPEEPNPHYAMVPIGADWTGNENVLGYPNGLDKAAYVSKPALEIILHATDHSNIPHFLILDEMNLSHVERYFADILSAIESDEGLELYPGEMDEPETWRKAGTTKAVPPKVRELPKNLFIIGTVNVDETTYMFSPKVLDRANVIEFRMDADDMRNFLGNPAKPDLSKLGGLGVSFGKSFVDAASSPVPNLVNPLKAAYEAEVLQFFKALGAHGSEFGYRTAYEVARFVYFYHLLGEGKIWNASADAGQGAWSDTDDAGREWFAHAFDCVVFQKFLPKLHGSRVKLGPLLKKLWFLCVNDSAGRGDDAIKAADEAARSTDKKDEPSAEVRAGVPYPLSAEKIGRMWRLLIDNGFASFAEQ